MAKYRNTRRSAYGISSPLPELTPLPVIAQRDPTTEDNGYELGTQWINQPDDHVYILTSVTASSANWEPISQSAGGNAPISKYVVDADGTADYTTVQAALDAANAAGGGVVWCRPGTYTENLTLYDLVNIRGSVTFGPVTITGVHTPPASGTIVFQDIQLTSATHIFNSAAAGTTDIFLTYCLANCTNGYCFNLPNWTGRLDVSYTDVAGTDNGWVNNTAGARLNAVSAGLGAGSANPFITSGGNITLYDTQIRPPGTFGGAATVSIEACRILATITSAGTAGLVIDRTEFETGATPSIIHNSSTIMSLTQLTINSSNLPAVDGTGAGTIYIGSIDWYSNSDFATTLTIDYYRTTDRVSPYIVGVTAQYKTIQEAIDASDIKIFPKIIIIQGGYYIENLDFSGLSFARNLHLIGMAVDSEGAIDGVGINGTHNMISDGLIHFENICFLSGVGGANIFDSAVAGGGASRIVFKNCRSSLLNSYFLNLPNWVSRIFIYEHHNYDSGLSDSLINNTGGAEILIHDSTVGSLTGLTSVISGPVEIKDSVVRMPVDFQTGSILDCNQTEFQSTFTLSNNSTGTFDGCRFKTSANPIATMSSTGDFEFTRCTVTSSASPVIAGAGAGTVLLSGIEFTDGSDLAATLTLTHDAETRSTKLLCGDATFRVDTLTTDYNVLQAFATTTDTIVAQINAIEGNMVVASTASILQPTGTYGYCEQADGSAITSTAAGVEGHLNLLETDNADLPPVYAFAVKGYLDAADTTGIPAGIVAGVGSVVEYNSPFNAKAYGVAVSRLDAGAGAGTAGQAAFGIVQGTVAIADWLYGLDLYNGGTGVAYTTADIRLWNQATIASAAAGITITSVAGDDFDIVLGDAAGANNFALQSSTPADIFVVDSIGNTTIDGHLDLDAAGHGIFITEGGAAAYMGTATLAGGTITVNTTAVTANTRIHLTPQGVLAGVIYVSARVAGTSFTITSTNGADTPAVAWLLVEPS